MCEQGSAFVATGEASLRIELCPEHIREPTLGALMYWLADQNIERVVLAIHDNGWMHEVFPTRRLAQRRIVDVVSLARCNTAGRFRSKSLSLGALDPHHPMRALVAECGPGLDQPRVADILRNGLRNRFTAIRLERQSGALVVEGMGDGYTMFDEKARMALVGKRIDDQLDFDYGRWIASGFRNMLQRGEPVIEDVDAIVARPSLVRYRYRRLVVPATRGAETWLLTTSIAIPGVELISPACRPPVPPDDLGDRIS